MPEENLTKDGEDRGVTKDGIPKAKTGPKIGSTMFRGKKMKLSNTSKRSVNALDARVQELEEDAGRGGPLDPKTYPDGRVPQSAKDAARDFIYKHMDKNGMYFVLKGNKEAIAVHSVYRDDVYIYRKGLMGGQANCIEMPVREFIEKSGLRFRV